MILSINASISPTDKYFTFDKEESKHLVKVLRRKEGDTVYITDGKGHFFTSNILFANDKKCEVEITEVTFKEKNRKYYLHIAIAPTKLNDRFEWFLEKSTEIGIDEITPIICENSERKVLKVARMKKIIQSATKQSLQTHLPVLNEPISFKEFMEKCDHKTKLVAHCDNEDEKILLAQSSPDHDICVLIGPEGDFHTDEIELAKSNGFIATTFGENRLRTETAGIYATSVISTLF